MAVTVKKEKASGFNFKRSGDLFTLQNGMTVTLDITHNGTSKTIAMEFKKGFICDGHSVPKKFQKILPRWKNGNMKYDLAAVVHDAMYFNKGFGMFTRSEADDFYRGILRDSGVNRLICSTADKALELFGSDHWGEDSFGTKDLVKVK